MGVHKTADSRAYSPESPLRSAQKMNSTSFHLVLLLFSFWAGISAQGQTSTTGSTSEGIWSIQYDIEDGLLSWAVIAGPSRDGIKGPVTMVSSNTDGKAREAIKKAIFHHPNGEEIDLSGTRRVIHLSREIISELVEPIDPRTFEAFLTSGTDDLRLSALLRFKASQEPNQANAEHAVGLKRQGR